MPKTTEVLLGNAQHTLYSDEPWYLIVSDDAGEVALEARFQSDAPERTGFPHWATTEFCVSKSGEEAICRVPFPTVAELLSAERCPVVPEPIWSRALEECRKIPATSRPSGA